MVSEIVPIVLRELARQYTGGHLTEEEFQTKLKRLENEELDPKNLKLLMRKLSDGKIRFLIKDLHDHVCELLDCSQPVSEKEPAEPALFTHDAASMPFHGSVRIRSRLT